MHAAAAPEKGRSALDGLMLMATAVEFLREHVPSATRIHYIVTKGGAAPNIVPDDAELFLYARHPSMTVLSGIWERILKCANGAAMATETTVECRIVSSDSNIVNNAPLGERVYHNFTEIGGLTYTPAEQAFAEKLFPLLPAGTTAKLGSANPNNRSHSAHRFMKLCCLDKSEIGKNRIAIETAGNLALRAPGNYFRCATSRSSAKMTTGIIASMA